MANATIRIEGLAAFRRDLRRIDPQLLSGVRDGLRRAADIVAQEARVRAPVGTGRLRGSIRPFTSGNRAGVRVNARRASRRYPGGYPYPRRFEFGDFNRPFIGPALEAKRSDVVDELERVLDTVARTWRG